MKFSRQQGRNARSVVVDNTMDDVDRRREQKGRLSVSLEEAGEPPSISQILLQKLGMQTDDDDEEWLEPENRRVLTAESDGVTIGVG